MAELSRREAILAGGAAALAGAMGPRPAQASQEGKVVKIGKIKQSVSKWCYDKYKLEELCRICKAILKTGFTGYVAHEFKPKKADPIKSLRDAAALCDVDA